MVKIYEQLPPEPKYPAVADQSLNELAQAILAELDADEVLRQSIQDLLPDTGNLESPGRGDELRYAVRQVLATQDAATRRRCGRKLADILIPWERSLFKPDIRKSGFTGILGGNGLKATTVYWQAKTQVRPVGGVMSKVKALVVKCSTI